MKAVTFQGNDQPLSVKTIPTPQPGPGQLLIKVGACGICGSDLHAYQANMPPMGNTFGHEFAGDIVAVGEGVSEQWQVGDRAMALGAIVCGECVHCLEGNHVQCDQMDKIGFECHGAYAEYVIAQAITSTKIPPEIDYPQAALVEPLAVGLTAFRDCQLPLGGNVLVLGAGIIGISVVKWARFFGAENILISDLETQRLDRAKRAGATGIINASEHADAVQAFREQTGVEPDVIVECVGRPMLQHLVDTAPNAGHIVSVGAAIDADPISPWAATVKKIRLTFSFAYKLQDFEFVLRVLAAKRMDTDHLITSTVSLDEVPEAFATLLKPNDHCKIMIQP